MKTNTTLKIANAPCSWGALEFDLEGKSPGYEQVLDEMADTEYTGTELGDWGFMPTDPAILKEELTNRKLELLGAFVPVAFASESAHEEGIKKALRVAGLMHAAGFPHAFIVLADDNGTVPNRARNAGRIQAEDGLDQQAMKTFAAGTEKVARAILDTYGMRSVFHHHCAGYIETPGEIDALMSLTDSSLLGLCFDTGHYMFGGGEDPAAALQQYGERVWHVHFKDFSRVVANEAMRHGWDYFESVRHGVFCELGRGEVDFKKVKKVLEEWGYEGWIVVEQDVLPGMGNPKLYAKNNREYLRSIGL